MRTERASALLLTVFWAFLSFTTLLIFLALLSNQIAWINDDYKGIQAFYLAESGIVKTAAYLEKNKNCQVPWIDKIQTLADGKQYLVQLSLSPGGSFLQLISWGRVNNEQALVSKKVSAQVHFFQSAFTYALITQEKLSGENVEILGRVNAQKIDLIDSCVNGQVSSEFIALPFFLESDYEKTKEWTDKSVLQSGFYLCQGDWLLDKQLRGRGIIYVRGKVRIKEKIQGKIAILAEDSINVAKDIEGVLLYSKKEINVAPEVKIRGCLVAYKNISLGKGCKIDYLSPYQVSNWQYKDYAPWP